MPDFEITHRRVDTADISFGVLEAGVGPLALCLHGFPDTAHTWRHLLPELAAAGYHAVAPFLRGYAPSTTPSDGSYQLGALVSDAGALHQALGADDRAVVIGHDWGAGVAYGAAAFAPTRWAKVVILAVPPSAVAMPFMGTYDQLKRSWYMNLAASPYGEMLLAANDFDFVDRLWRDWSPGFDASQILPDVHACFAVPGSLDAALAYYRAALDPSGDRPEYASMHAAGLALAPQPTLYLHGADDGCIGSEVVPAAQAYLTSPGSRVQVVSGAGHFLQVEKPAEVNRAILDHLLG